jgi:hypothetical protein
MADTIKNPRPGPTIVLFFGIGMLILQKPPESKAPLCGSHYYVLFIILDTFFFKENMLYPEKYINHKNNLKM